MESMKKHPPPAPRVDDQEAAAVPPSRSESPPLPIAGLGASAGGLEALEQFLRHVPEDSGMAFVVVQHLDPTHKAMLTELLQRVTKMETFQAKDRMQVRPNSVYVIPPNKDMSILHGVLHLFAPTTPRGLRLPIDYFFRSLAEDRRELSIGVILSGMGSDGTMGLRAIKEKAGVALVQEPASARFDSMPRSAIDAGFADLVTPAEELPGKIIGYLRHARTIAKSEQPLEEKAGAGGRQGQLEYFLHGPRGAPLRSGDRLPEGAPAERGDHRQGAQGRRGWRDPDRRSHRPGARRAGGAAGHGDDRLLRRADTRRKEIARPFAGRGSEQRPGARVGVGTSAGPRGIGDASRGNTILAGRT